MGGMKIAIELRKKVSEEEQKLEIADFDMRIRHQEIYSVQTVDLGKRILERLEHMKLERKLAIERHKVPDLITQTWESEKI